MRLWHWLLDAVRKNPWLAATLAVAFLLRVATIAWGLPLSPHTNFYHGDEAKAYTSTIFFPAGYLASESYLYGTAIQYAVGLLLLPLKLVMVGVFGQAEEFGLTAIVCFRFCNGVMGTASVYLVYRLGWRLLDPRAGLIAAMLLAVSLFPALNSCLTTLDVPMSFLLLCCCLACCHAVEQPSPRAFVLAGLAAGMLLGTKVTGALFVGVATLWLAGSLFRQDAEQRLSPAEQLKLLLLFLLTTTAVFAVSTPHVVLDFGEFWSFMMNQKENWYDKADPTIGGVLHAWFDGTSLAAGVAVAVTAPVGLVLLGKARGRAALLLGLWVGV